MASIFREQLLINVNKLQKATRDFKTTVPLQEMAMSKLKNKQMASARVQKRK